MSKGLLYTTNNKSSYWFQYISYLGNQNKLIFLSRVITRLWTGGRLGFLCMRWPLAILPFSRTNLFKFMRKLSLEGYVYFVHVDIYSILILDLVSSNTTRTKKLHYEKKQKTMTCKFGFTYPLHCNQITI